MGKLLKAKPIGRDRLTLEFDDYKLLPLLFGQHDRNLARIEQKLHVSIACFGSTIELKGNTLAITKARVTLEALYLYILYAIVQIPTRYLWN